MTANSLLELQHAVQNMLLRPQQPIGDMISETTAVPRAVRLAIYANGYRARFVEAMSADYNALHRYLGDAEFEQLINAYIEAHPSRYFSMRFVGSYLSDFLANTEPYNTHRDLYELAQFEWALCHAFDAADDASLSLDAMRRIEPSAWPALRLQFHPSLQRLLLHGNAPALWTALNAEQQPPAFVASIEASPWLVWRHQLRLLFRPFADYEALVFDAFYTGADFSEVCAQLSDCIAAEQVPGMIAGFIQQWLQEGLVVGAGVGAC